MNEQQQQNQITPPTTIEGIGIHIGYMTRDLGALNKKMDSVVSNTVSRAEGDALSKNLADHETRIRDIETETEGYSLVKKLVFGCVAFILVAVLGAIVYSVVQK